MSIYFISALITDRVSQAVKKAIQYDTFSSNTIKVNRKNMMPPSFYYVTETYTMERDELKSKL